MKPADKKPKSYGTSTKIGVAADVDVPIVRTGKPEVTVIEPNVKKKGKP